MKKQYLAVAFLAVALGITACSSKKADTESTTAQAVESTEATSDEEVEEDEAEQTEETDQQTEETAASPYEDSVVDSTDIYD